MPTCTGFTDGFLWTKKLRGLEPLETEAAQLARGAGLVLGRAEYLSADMEVLISSILFILRGRVSLRWPCLA